MFVTDMGSTCRRGAWLVSAVLCFACSAEGFVGSAGALRGSVRVASAGAGVSLRPVVARAGRIGAAAVRLSAAAGSEAGTKVNVREQMHPTIGKLANILEETMKEKLDLEPYVDRDAMDMMYVEGEDFIDGQRCVIQNSMWQSPEFRKIHIECAIFLNSKGERSGLDILHAVLFPRYGSVGPEVPMFGCDLVAMKGSISAAICDLSPMTKEKKVPADYREAFEKRVGDLAKYATPRDVPEFGQSIFGDKCVFVRPADAAENEQFLKMCKEIMSLHCDLASTRVGVPLSEEQKEEAFEAQTYYCSQQSKNDKTTRILQQAFGNEWTDRYMKNILFDAPKK